MAWLIFLAVWSGRATVISPVVAFVLMLATEVMKRDFMKCLIFSALLICERATELSPVMAFVLIIGTNLAIWEYYITDKAIIWCVKKLFQIACILNLLAVFFYSTFGTG